MKKQVIETKKLPKPVGPYSQGIKIKAGSLLFLSGQVARDHERNIIGKGDITAQTDQVLRNLQAGLEAGGASLKDVVKLGIYLTNIDDYEKISNVRSKYFKDPFPSSTLVEVKRLLDKDLLIEIDAIAVLND